MNPVSKPLKSPHLQQLIPAAMAWAFSVNASGLAKGKPLSSVSGGRRYRSRRQET